MASSQLGAIMRAWRGLHLHAGDAEVVVGQRDAPQVVAVSAPQTAPSAC